jgi:hypothetical protein
MSFFRRGPDAGRLRPPSAMPRRPQTGCWRCPASFFRLGRPVIFLAAQCFAIGLMLAPLSLGLTLIFATAALGALLLFTYLYCRSAALAVD